MSIVINGREWADERAPYCLWLIEHLYDSSHVGEYRRYREWYTSTFGQTLILDLSGSDFSLVLHFLEMSLGIPRTHGLIYQCLLLDHYV